MIKIHYGKLTPTVFSATTSQAGYPATNLGSESILKPWRAAALGAEDVALQLPAVAMIQTFALHDVNFAAATIEKSVDGAVWVAVGAMTTYADRHGRRRGVITINTAGQKAVRFRIAAGASTDGLAYWRAGAGYLFGSVVNVGAAVEYGYRVRTRRPRVAVEMVNGDVATAVTGANVDRIELNFPRQDTESVDEIIQRASAGTCWMDMVRSNYPEQQWPVRCVDADIEETFSARNISANAIALRERA